MVSKHGNEEQGQIILITPMILPLALLWRLNQAEYSLDYSQLFPRSQHNQQKQEDDRHRGMTNNLDIWLSIV